MRHVSAPKSSNFKWQGFFVCLFFFFCCFCLFGFVCFRKVIWQWRKCYCVHLQLVLLHKEVWSYMHRCKLLAKAALFFPKGWGVSTEHVNASFGQRAFLFLCAPWRWLTAGTAPDQQSPSTGKAATSLKWRRTVCPGLLSLSCVRWFLSPCWWSTRWPERAEVSSR